MKTWIEHQWGKIEKDWHVSSIQLASVEPGEEDQALLLGFISDDADPDYWYNCRSVRVPLKKNARPYKGDLECVISDVPAKACSDIYHTWCETKGFVSHPGDEGFQPSDKAFHYLVNGKIVAYSKIRMYKESAELLVHASVVDKTAMESLKYELYWLRQSGFKWAYIGQGYENCSVWKSELSKMEWWNGREWIKDNSKLKELCELDSKVEFDGFEYD